MNGRSRSSCSGMKLLTSDPIPVPPVNDEDYQVPFAFTGKLNKLTLKLDRPQLSPADIKRLDSGAAEQPGK